MSDLIRIEQLYHLTPHKTTVTGVAVTPDGQRMVSVSEDETLKIWGAGMPRWEFASGRPLKTLINHTAGPAGLTGVVITPDGQRVISASEDDTLKIWDLNSGQLLMTIPEPVCKIAVTPNGQQIVTSWDKTLKLWELKSGRLLNTLVGHDEWVEAVAITPDGQQIISGSSDETLKIWHLANGIIVKTLTDRSGQVGVVTDGQRIVAAGWDKALKIWDLERGKLLKTLKGHTSYIEGLALAGELIISAAEDKTVRAWHLTTGQCLATLHLNEPLSSCTIAPDGQTVVVGGKLGSVYVLRLSGPIAPKAKIKKEIK